MGIRLGSIRVASYLGARRTGATLELNPNLTAICGPNNSGKTTLLSAISLLSGSLCSQLRMEQGSTISFGWMQAQGATEDIFNFYDQNGECFFDLDYFASYDLIQKFGSGVGDSLPREAAPISIGIAARIGQKRLQSLSVANEPIFMKDSETRYFKPSSGSGDYLLMTPRSRAFILLVEQLLVGRVVYFSSFRDLRPARQAGDDFDLNRLASGAGLISFVQSAMHPDLKDPVSRRRNILLREFEREFADFANFREFELSVPPSADELNAHVNGNAQPISRMGAGIGECLLIMLVSKLSRELPLLLNRSSVDVLMVEEPELHLHPRLQRTLLEYLIGYGRTNGTQVVFSTHSPTVLNVVQREGGSIYRTEWNESLRTIELHPANSTDQILKLLKDIGASPGDLLQAEKVLWVEGPHDIPVFREWIAKAPTFKNQVISFVSLGGDDSASDDFDVNQLKLLNPNAFVILDSERSGQGAPAANAREKTRQKCESVGIDCHLTERRNTESYFTVAAAATVYSTSVPATLDPFVKLRDQIPNFDKDDCGRIAAAMSWSDIESTDVGIAIERFLNS
jgi:predicted ATPase